MEKISKAELEVLQVVWKKQKTTSLEIINTLSYKNWSSNTIRTLIGRLVNKKAIGIAEKNGKTYTYIAIMSEEKYKNYITKDFIKRYYNNSISEFIKTMLKENKIAYKDIEEILECFKK